MSSTPSAKARGDEAGPRIAPGLGELGEDVPHGRQAEGPVDELPRVERLQPRLVAHQRAQVAAAGGDDAAGEAVGFGMHRRGVERLARRRGCAGSRRIARRPAAPRRGTDEQVLAAAEGALRVAVGDDRLGERRPEAGDMREQRRRGHVEIDPDRVHRILDHRLQRMPQAVLVDVMLILSDPDGLRIDLDEFGQRVLQTASNGDRSAHSEVEVRELLRREFGGGIDRGARLRDDHLGRLRRRQRGEHLGDQPLGLAAGRCRCRWRRARRRGWRISAASVGLGAADVVPRLEGINRDGQQGIEIIVATLLAR